MKGGYFKVVQRFFPNLRFSNNKSDWSSLEQRRLFFEDFATKEGFNHQDPHNWYTQPVARIMAQEVSLSSCPPFFFFLFFFVLCKNHIFTNLLVNNGR